MKAIVHANVTGFAGVSFTDIDLPPLAEGQVKVALKTAGLNRRDLMVPKKHQASDAPLIIGSDGAGVITEMGAGVSGFELGDEVIINPALGWFEKSDAPPQGFEILGLPDHGTFAEAIHISSDQIEKKPNHLSWEEAGVLPLAALTAYRALFTRGKVKAGDTVMIPGIGSGVATYVLQFAKKVGATVIVTSRSEAKQKQALELGADIAIDTNLDWNEQLGGKKVDLLIESIGQATFEKSLNQIRPGGTIVTFGATTEDKVTIDIRQFFYGQFHLLGSTMGSREEFREMLTFIEKQQIKPVIDQVYPLSEGKAALLRLQESHNFGKIGLKISE